MKTFKRKRVGQTDLPKKAGNSQNKIISNENDKIISNNEEVAEIFNDYFVNVADGIGKDYHYVNVSVLIKFSQKTSLFTLIIISSP